MFNQDFPKFKMIKYLMFKLEEKVKIIGIII